MIYVTLNDILYMDNFIYLFCVKLLSSVRIRKKSHIKIVQQTGGIKILYSCKNSNVSSVVASITTCDGCT